MSAINKYIADLLMETNKIDLLKYEETFLNKSLQKRIMETKSRSLEEYYNLLKINDLEGKIFLDSLSINFSEFFRNSLTFAVLERLVLPSLMLRKKKNQQKEMRIWSSACAGGQEVYSLAILLEELNETSLEKFNYRIFATDQDHSQILEAKEGLFPFSTLQNVSIKRFKRWFTENGDAYAVKNELKQNIDFSGFDLFDEQFSSPPASIFGDFDLVICANLLFYYKTEYREVIINKIGNSLSESGFLVTGEAEREIFLYYDYHEVFPYSAIFHLR